MKKKSKSTHQISENRKARHDYFFEKILDAGMVLLGWEVKSIRLGKLQLKESHIIIKDEEIFLLNANISVLKTTSTHNKPNPTRTRKLLLNKKEIKKLIGEVQQKGYTLIPVSAFWKNSFIKLKIALASGKKQYDKRDTIKKREWQIEQGRIIKQTRG